MAIDTSFLVRNVHRLVMRRLIIGYPRSGNTWFSALWRHLIIDAYDLPAQQMPRLFMTDGPVIDIPRRFFSVPLDVLGTYLSHGYRTNPLDVTLDAMRGFIETADVARTIILMRDPKDVIVSYYLRRVYRMGQSGVGTIEEFARDPLYGIDRYLAYYNLLAEARQRSKQPTQVVRYEEMWADTAAVLRRSAQFFGLKGVTEASIARAVAQCSFENMRRMEKEATPGSVKVPYLYRASTDDANARHVRKGGSGNWHEHLAEETGAWIDARVERQLAPFYRRSPDGETSVTQVA